MNKLAANTTIRVVAPGASALVAERWQTSNRQLVQIVLLAFALRMLLVAFMYDMQMSPDRDHWSFGWEMGRIARSLASGRGFSSPFFNETGPTAWMPPLYPWILAGVFKIFGVYTVSSAIVILTFNALLSSLTCLPLFDIAAKTLNERTARMTAFLWVFFPYSLYFTAGRVWPFALNVLFLTLLVWACLRLQNRGDTRSWAAFGLLAGANALANPVALAPVPLFIGWVVWKLRRDCRPVVVPLLTMSIVFIAICLPWTIRNYAVFHRVIPIRGNFWAEMRVGNNGDLSDIWPEWAHPSGGTAELAEYERLGDQGYERAKEFETLAFLRRHKAWFVWASFRRFVYVWTGFWTTEPGFNKKEPTHYPNVVLCSALTIMMLIGLQKVWHRNRRNALLYVIVLFMYPTIYYISHILMDYRHPMDALILALCVFAFTNRVPRTSSAPT